MGHGRQHNSLLTRSQPSMFNRGVVFLSRSVFSVFRLPAGVYRIWAPLLALHCYHPGQYRLLFIAWCSVYLRFWSCQSVTKLLRCFEWKTSKIQPVRKDTKSTAPRIYSNNHRRTWRMEFKGRTLRCINSSNKPHRGNLRLSISNVSCHAPKCLIID